MIIRQLQSIIDSIDLTLEHYKLGKIIEMSKEGKRLNMYSDWYREQNSFRFTIVCIVNLLTRYKHSISYKKDILNIRYGRKYYKYD